MTSPKAITEAGELRGKRVLVRVDWNVPISGGVVVDDYRIRNSLATLEYLKEQGAKSIIVGHLDSKEGNSFEPVFNYVKEFFPLSFSREITGDQVKEKIESLEEGEALLLENIRRDSGEKENGEELSRELAALADVFVNEAFSESHRSYASIVGVAKFLPGYLGIQFHKEIQHLSQAFYPKRPFLLIMGGAKFETKIPIITKFMNIADDIFVGGALANDLLKERGFEVGKSLVSKGGLNLKDIAQSSKIILPTDVVVKRDGKSHIISQDKVLEEDVIVDAGPNTLLEIKDMVARSSSILWNGPLGNYEEGYREPTLELARFLAESGKETILGGGDTLAAIRDLNLTEKFSFVSTGGGAMLDFLAQGTLPGIEALN